MEAFGAADGDEELFVVIVGDEEENPDVQQQSGDSSNRRKQVIRVKKEFTEVEEEDEGSPGPAEYLEPDFEDLLKTAEENGDLIPVQIKSSTKGKKKGKTQKQVKSTTKIKREPVDTQDVEIKEEPQDDEIWEAEFMKSDSDDDYMPEKDVDYSEDEDEVGIKKRPKAGKKEKHRYKLRGAHEQVSFVQQLREHYPELAADEELLIETLCQCMIQTKPPDPPQDYFVIQDADFECVTCGAQKQSLPAMERHWQETHGPRYLICYSCGVDFRSKTNLYKHEKRCNSLDAKTVLQARARFVGSKGRSRPYLLPPHLLNVRRNAKYGKLWKSIYGDTGEDSGSNSTCRRVPVEKPRSKCSQCPAEFTSKHALRSHEFAHVGVRPFRCDQCPLAYTSHTALHRHQHAKHKNEEYICDACGRSFNCKSSLVQHLQVHQPVRKYECSYCERRFAQNQALKLHIDKIHFNLPPPCACQICPKRFPRMSILKTHMLKAHGMNLITKTMFYKTLPKLSETQIKEAKVVLKSENKFNEQKADLQLLDFLAKQKDTNSEPDDITPDV